MRVDMRRRLAGIATGLVMATAPATAMAQAVNTTNYDEAYARYLAAARRSDSARPMWMGDLMSDPNARHINDLVTIRVVESLSASGSADSNVGKAGSSAVVFPGDLGKQLGKVFPNASSTKFNGAGGTTRSTELSATITARVVEVLPSGDMVVEAVREVDINGDRSVVVLSGVVRPMDIQPGNVIPSSMVGQFRIRSLSAGLVKDSLTPGWLIRALNKVF